MLRNYVCHSERATYHRPTVSGRFNIINIFIIIILSEDEIFVQLKKKEKHLRQDANWSTKPKLCLLCEPGTLAFDINISVKFDRSFSLYHTRSESSYSVLGFFIGKDKCKSNLTRNFCF